MPELILPILGLGAITAGTALGIIGKEKPETAWINVVGYALAGVGVILLMAASKGAVTP